MKSLSQNDQAIYIQGLIYNMPEKDQALVKYYQKQFKELLVKGGDHATLAIAIEAAKLCGDK